MHKLDINQVYNGDSNLMIKSIESESVDLVIIDPPYKIRKKTDEINSLAKAVKKYNEELQRDNLINEYDKSILEELVRVMKRINIYIWCNGEQIPSYIDFFVNKYKCKMDILVWNKTNAMPLFNNKYMTDKEYCLYFRKGGYCNPQCYEDAKTDSDFDNLNAIEENSPNFKNNDGEWIYSESDDSFELWCNGEYNSNNYSIQIKKYELDKEKELSDEYEL